MTDIPATNVSTNIFIRKFEGGAKVADLGYRSHHPLAIPAEGENVEIKDNQTGVTISGVVTKIVHRHSIGNEIAPHYMNQSIEVIVE